MFFIPNECYHIYNRGNNKNLLFYNDDNYLLFLNKIQKTIKPFCDILCWTFMPNHFHLMINANEKSIQNRLAGKLEIQELSYRIGILLSSYSQTINKQNGTTGSLFQQRTKAKDLTTMSLNFKEDRGNYLITCMHYIHQNAWKAGLVSRIEDWKYSSFPDYCGFRNGTLCNKTLLFELTGYDSERFYQDSYEIVPEEIFRNFY
ncbi:MAG: transposase [Bacteroidota bacterium]|nr:transposase [Bacteroidota bacterium]